eukprot:2323737-Rhodomonas_salina.1
MQEADMAILLLDSLMLRMEDYLFVLQNISHAFTPIWEQKMEQADNEIKINMRYMKKFMQNKLEWSPGVHRRAECHCLYAETKCDCDACKYTLAVHRRK